MPVNTHSNLFRTVVFCGESNDNAHNKELQISQETLYRGSLDSVNVKYSICIDVPSSIECNDVGKAVLAEQELNDERTFLFFAVGNILRCIFKSNLTVVA